MSPLDQLHPTTLVLMRRRVREANDSDRPTTLALMRFIKDNDLAWPVSRVTRARVENVLLRCGFYQDLESGFWYVSRPIPAPTPFNLLDEAIGVIEGLADQQAMPDDWYREPLIRFKKAREDLRPGA